MIDDAGDPRLADYVGLRDPARRQRVEADGGFFIVEGRLAIERLLDLGTWPIRSLLLTPKLSARLADRLTADGVPVYEAEPAVLAAVAGFDLHRGAVASVDRRPPWPSDVHGLLAQAGTAPIAVLEGINDHENLGALFRNAAAFGIGAVLLDETSADPLYRRSVRVSMGHVLAVPHARYQSLDQIADSGFLTVALTPEPSAQSIDDFAAELAAPTEAVGPGQLPRRPDRVALLLGAEGPGLTPATLARADRRVRIPLAADVDSLNVATAAAIAFHRLSPVT